LIVVDTNVLAYLLLPGPRTELAELLRRQHRQWAAPLLWRSEFRNVLTIQIRQDLLKLPEAIALMQSAERIMAPHEESVTSEHVLQLVSTSRCTSYDCEFVAAAQQLGVPLITEDRAILAAFPDLSQSLHQATC
jgi:predicted nucleic acid-binding protein